MIVIYFVSDRSEQKVGYILVRQMWNQRVQKCKTGTSKEAYEANFFSYSI